MPLPRPFRIRRSPARSRRLLLEPLEDRSLLAAVITVNSTLDTDARDSVLTLREAILISNRTLAIASLTQAEQNQVSGTPTADDTDTVAFNIPGSGVQTISPTTALPDITDPVTVDGYTQPGSSPNTNAIDDPDPTKRGFNGTLLIQLSGASAGHINGLNISAGNSTVRGLVINQFHGTGQFDQGNAIFIGAGGGNVIAGNFLGTSASGDSVLANEFGLFIGPESSGNTIGGTSPAARNVVSGNISGGMYVEGPTNVVAGNFIGTNATGIAALGNGIFQGLYVGGYKASGNVVGGTSAGARNLISGNNSLGIYSAGTSTLIQGNLIGTDVTGKAPLGNYHGIQDDGKGDTIGGTAVGAANVVAFNTRDGVFVQSINSANPGLNESILGNSIFNNGFRGIELSAGSNNDQASPSLSQAAISGTSLTLSYSVSSSVAKSAYPLRVEFFKADSTGKQGQTFLGFDTYTAAQALTTKAVSFTSPVTIGLGERIVATATDGAGNTSEFSVPIFVQGTTCSTIVTNTNDSGAGSLRDAIACANSTPGKDTVAFNIPGSGLHTISPTLPLPGITDPVVIDAYTQPGASPNTNSPGLGSNADLQIEISGSGLMLHTNDSTIRGLVINHAVTGVYILDGSNNHIEGNFIGTNATGTIALPALGTDGDGITIVSTNAAAAIGNVIGGASPAARNLISGSHNSGIALYASQSVNATVIQGNFIGTDATGTKPLPNNIGISIWPSVHSTVVGGSGPGEGNLISGNLTDGLALGANQDACGGGVNRLSGRSTGNVIRGNKIGADISGTKPLGNGASGILIGFDDPASTVMIGGTGAGDGNIIAFNGTNGISPMGSPGVVGTHTAILSNSIFSNAALGISFFSTCIPTPNDLGDADAGPSNLQNFPVIVAAAVNGTQLAVSYTVPSDPANSQYPIRVQFFKADADGQEGQVFLGDDLYEATEAGTVASIVFTPLVPLATGDKIVATASDNFGIGNTSEFSSAAATLPLCSTLVINTNDSGPGSLRDAITCANATPGTNTIAFNIPGTGVQTISPTSALPTITDPVIIDGYTQPGAMANTNAIDDPDPAQRGLSGTLLIQLSGPAGGTPAMSGLAITAGGSTVRGLVINSFANSGIAISGGDNNVIVGNYIGTDPTGMSAVGNGKWGLLINTGSAGNRVGTDGDGASDAAERNLIGGSGFGGIGIVGAGSDRNVVAGNLIGTNRLGTAALGNANRGVDITTGAQQNRIGTNSDGVNDGAERNVISGNGWEGVGINGAGTNNNVVAGNYIGIDISGSSALSNVLAGVTIFGGASGNVIGGSLPGSGNTIAFNQQNGVTVINPASIDNAILGNSIFLNARLGIDLGNDGATANDSGDPDVGGNNKQNSPEITYATRDNGQLKLTYNLSSDPANSTYPLHVELFKADTDGQEGQTFLGADTFTAADFAAGGKTTIFTTASQIKVFDKIVATATDSLPTGGPANTSEFSPSAVIDSPWHNPRNRLDVNDDTHVAANDVVAVVNYLNASKGGGPVPDDADNSQPFLDTNGDNNVAPNDALDIINAINAGQDSEGEARDSAAASQLPVTNDLLALLAADPAIQSPRRRR